MKSVPISLGAALVLPHRHCARWLLGVSVSLLLCDFDANAGYPNNVNDDDDEYAIQFGAPTSTGVSTWHVSEPYINLWILNQPLTYHDSCDKPVGFAVVYKQRNSRDYLCGSVGPGWETSYLSYVYHYKYDYSSPCTTYM